MTKDELRNAIFDEMVQAYYRSNVCQMLDGCEYAVELENFSRSRMEDDIMELVDELADAAMDAMEENGVLKAKKHEHQV